MAIAESFALSRVTTVGDYFALLKPRVMSLVIFTGLAGIVVGAGACPSAHRLYRPSVHRGGGGRFRRAEHGL